MVTNCPEQFNKEWCSCQEWFSKFIKPSLYKGIYLIMNEDKDNAIAVVNEGSRFNQQEG